MVIDNAVVIDTETTGLNPATCSLLSIALVPLRADLKPLQVFVQPAVLCFDGEFAQRNFAKFSAEWCTRAVSCRLAVNLIHDYLEQISHSPVTPIGHNVGFDLGFIRKLCSEAGGYISTYLPGLSHRGIDTHSMLVACSIAGLIPASVRSLDAALAHFNIQVEEKDRHTALGDALATKELFLKLTDLLEKR